MNFYKKKGDAGLLDRRETFKEKINRLNKNLELCKEYKEEAIQRSRRLEEQYKKRIFSYTEYEYLLNQYLKGMPLDYWVSYYDSQEKNIKEKIKNLHLQKRQRLFEREKIISEKRSVNLNYKKIAYGFIAFMLVLGLAFSFYHTFSSSGNFITGFGIVEQDDNGFIMDYNPHTDVIFKAGSSQVFTVTAQPLENTVIQWYVNNMAVEGQNSETFSYTAETPGEYEVKVLIHDMQNYSTIKWDVKVEEDVTTPSESVTLPDENVTLPEESIILPEENLTNPSESVTLPDENVTLPEESIILPEENITNPSENVTLPDENVHLPEENVTIPSENIILPEENVTTQIITQEQLPAEINKPVQWAVRAKKLSGSYLEVEIPAQAAMISVDRIIETLTLETGEIQEPVPKENITLKKGISSMSLSDYGLAEQSTTGFFITNIQSKGLLSTVTDWASFQFLIYKAYFSIRKALPSVFSISLKHGLTAFATAEEEKTTLIVTDEAEEFEIRYQTPAPQIKEKEEPDKKTVTVYSDMNYTNILTYTKINEEKTVLGVSWLVNDSAVNMTYQLHDEDSNGVIDKVSWITPHLSEQTFEVLISDKMEVLISDKMLMNYSYQTIIPTHRLTYLINCPGASCGNSPNPVEVGYIENPDSFCTITNSRDINPEGADLSAGMEFPLQDLPGSYDVAELCLYASLTLRNVEEEGIPSIHVKKEQAGLNLLETSIGNELDDTPLAEMKSIPGWNCLDITSVVKNAQSTGETNLRLRVAGQNLKDKEKDQYSCFRGIGSAMIGCSQEEQQGMSSDCSPVLRIKWN